MKHYEKPEVSVIELDLYSPILDASQVDDGDLNVDDEPTNELVF